MAATRTIHVPSGPLGDERPEALMGLGGPFSGAKGVRAPRGFLPGDGYAYGAVISQPAAALEPHRSGGPVVFAAPRGFIPA